jgi:LPXTG-motif cell wall-anchored protein
VSHLERQWTDSATAAPGEGWERSSTLPRVTTTSDTIYTDGDEQAPEGYTLVDEVATTITPAYTEYEWARTVVVVPGQDAVPAVMGVREVLVTPEVPATEEVSHMEDLVVTIPATDEIRLVSAAVPAGAACPSAPAGTDAPARPADSSRAASAVPSALAFTGADTQNYLAGGLVLVFLGAGLIVAARRRQDARD